jgi:hypothetical protein
MQSVFHFSIVDAAPTSVQTAQVPERESQNGEPSQVDDDEDDEEFLRDTVQCKLESSPKPRSSSTTKTPPKVKEEPSALGKRGT